MQARANLRSKAHIAASIYLALAMWLLCVTAGVPFTDPRAIIVLWFSIPLGAALTAGMELLFGYVDKRRGNLEAYRFAKHFARDCFASGLAMAPYYYATMVILYTVSTLF